MEAFQAMGTTVSLLLPQAQRIEGAMAVKALFAEWEQVLSRFRSDSELSQLNRHAGEIVIVSELLFTVMREALKAAQATDGIYDPTLLKQLVQLGYDRTFEQLSPEQPEVLYHRQTGGGWRAILLDARLRSIILPEDVQVDFGGIAKGMAVDAALVRLQELGIDNALVNAGGDLAVCGLPPGANHWSIAIAGKDISWVLPLHHGAVATSGVGQRHWLQGKERRHHLLDPRTGLPVQNGLWSVTVVAESCKQAEIAAKVAFILARSPERELENEPYSIVPQASVQAALKAEGNASTSDDFGPDCKESQQFLAKHRLAGLFVAANGAWQPGGCWPEHLMRRLS